MCVLSLRSRWPRQDEPQSETKEKRERRYYDGDTTTPAFPGERAGDIDGVGSGSIKRRKGQRSFDGRQETIDKQELKDAARRPVLCSQTTMLRRLQCESASFFEDMLEPVSSS